MLQRPVMKRFLALSLSVLALVVVASPSVAMTEDQTKKLQPALEDDFGIATRGDYRLEGEVTWSPGTNELAEGASARRAFAGRSWAKMEVDFSDDRGAWSS
ncbi:MAG: hypothetical protein AAGJ83_10510, partial [Planctomycetota bacterium]